MIFWLSILGMAVSLALPWSARASGACIAARFTPWGSLGPSVGNQGNICGMPQWWVDEPNINLWITDEPMNYTMSSGQQMKFRWIYKQDFEIQDQIACPNFYYTYNGGLSNRLGSDLYIQAKMYGMTNAIWSQNWMMDIVYWDAKGDNHTVSGGIDTFSPWINGFSCGFEALAFRPEGGTLYFSTNYGATCSFSYPSSITYPNQMADPQSQVRLQLLGTWAYPQYSWAANSQTSDANGIYWGVPYTNGLELVYSDGSKDVFSLFQGDVDQWTASTTRTLLTQRIDPQGRVTKLGYEWPSVRGPRTYRLRYIVDPDGRTNTLKYLAAPAYYNQLAEVDDPYGRKVQLQYGTGLNTNLLTSIKDAAGLTSSFSYQPGTGNGWITNLTTPYGISTFSYYDPPVSGMANGYSQRALYVNEPAGAQQLYYYLHVNYNLPSTDISPTVPGQTFDDGNPNSNLTPHYSLGYRNTFHWGRRQFAALSSSVQSAISSSYTSTSLSNALTLLTTYDYSKAYLKHWLLAADELSVASSLSSERDPSPDAGGQIPGLRTWYNYTNKPSPEIQGNLLVGCVARVLPNGTNYTVYHYNPFGSAYGGGEVSDIESSYSPPGGGVGVLTNWFSYANNSVDVLSVTNSAGQWINFGYNANHEITSITNALSQVTSFGWDNTTLNLTSISLPSGLSATLSYYTANPLNPNGSLLSDIVWTPTGRSLTYTYTNSLPQTVLNDRGLSVTNTWDGLNRLTGATYPDGTYVSNVYYNLDLGATRDRLGNWSLYGYDGLRHLTVITNANNTATFFDWCGCGSLNHIYDAQNGTTYPTTLNYDNQGNLTNVLFPDSTSITYQFDLAGRMTNAFDASTPPKSLQFGYNNQGLVTSVSNSAGTLQSVIYDAVNRPVSVIDANGVTVTNIYDAINELLSRKWADGVGEGFGYSAAGLTYYTNRDGQLTKYGLDAAGRIISVTNANLEVVQLGYDSLDNVTSLIDGLLHQTTWQYNQYGWLTNKSDGLTRNAFRFAYNANGWVTNRWTPEKGSTGYGYDNVGNLTNITYPQSSISYAYDALNRLTNVVSASFTNSFAYTPAGQLAVEAGPWPNDVVSNAYSQTLRMSLNQLQPSGSWAQTSYGYDSVWRVQSLASPAGSFGYTFNGGVSPLVKTITLPNTAWITNHYDALARLDYTGLANSSGLVLDGYAYAGDALGLRTNVTRDFGLMKSSVGAGYDKIGQVTSWTGRETNGTLRLNEQLGWAYDAADNLHYRTNNVLIQTFTADAANELTGVGRAGTFTESGNTPAPAVSVTVNGQAAQTYADFTFARTNFTLDNGQNSFTNVAVNPYQLKVTSTLTVNLPVSQTLLYDNNGNLTNDGTRSFSYDSENQLTNVSVAGSWKSDFVYDGLGRRRIARDYSWNGSAWIKTNEVRYVYDGMLAVQERDSNNVVQVTYTRGLDLSSSIGGAGGIGGLLARTDGNGSTFYHADGAGNVTGLMDGNQYMVGRYLYDPFGKLIGKWGSVADVNAMRFSSMPYYRNPGIVGYLGREYESNFERWLNQDPIQEAGGINLYRAMNNNSLSYIDPLGLINCSFLASVIGRQEHLVNGALQSMNDINKMSKSAYNWETYGAAPAYFLEVIPAGYALAENAAATAATKFTAGGVDYVVSATGLIRARGTSTFYYTLRKAAEARANGAVIAGVEEQALIGGKEIAGETGENWSQMVNANPLQGLVNAKNEMAQNMSARTYQTIRTLQGQLANMMYMYKQNCPCKK